MQEKPNHQVWMWRLLAGLQAGIVAALIMAGYLLFANLLFASSPWRAPHLFAAAMLGPEALRPSFGATTLFGYSLLLLSAGGEGLLFGALVPPRVSTIWSVNLGIAYSLGWYLLVFRYLLSRWDSWSFRGITGSVLLFGYFLFGAALGLYVRYYRQLSRPLPAPPAGEWQVPQVSDK